MENRISSTKKCYICESEATCLCFQCSNYFCEKCYKYVHDLKNNNNHKKRTNRSFCSF